MKNLLALSLVIFSLSSCNETGTSSTSSVGESRGTSMASTYESSVQQIYRACETGDVSNLDTLFSDDYIDHAGPNGVDVKGVDSLKAALADMHNHVKDLKMTVQTIAANNEYGLDCVKVTGTAADNSWGLSPGSKIESLSVNMVKFKNGKIAEHWRFLDVKEAMAMMKKPPMANNKTSGKSK